MSTGPPAAALSLRQPVTGPPAAALSLSQLVAGPLAAAPSMNQPLPDHARCWFQLPGQIATMFQCVEDGSGGIGASQRLDRSSRLKV